MLKLFAVMLLYAENFVSGQSSVTVCFMVFVGGSKPNLESACFNMLIFFLMNTKSEQIFWFSWIKLSNAAICERNILMFGFLLR